MITNEEIKQGFEILFQPYLDGYRSRVKELYQEEYEKNSDAFLYIQPVKICVLLNENDSYVIFSKSKKDEIVFVAPPLVSQTEIAAFKDNPEKLQKAFMKNKLGVEDFYDYMQYFAVLRYIGGAYFNKINHPTLVNEAYLSGIKDADSHASNIEFYKSLNNVLSQNTSLEHIDINNIISKVNNPSFKYEFEESVKAYNTELYLAAAATGGIALENILKQLIKRKLGPQYLPDKTYIWKSVDVLTKNKILPGRLRGRINQQSEIRNTNSHTNDDPVTKETVDNLYGVIRDISNLFS